MNKSGIKPFEYKVLIQQDAVETKSKTGIILSSGELTKKEQWAQTTGTLVAAGGNAFQDWVGDIPKLGDRVIYRQYTGNMRDGLDGEKYQLCNDKDIIAGLVGVANV